MVNILNCKLNYILQRNATQRNATQRNATQRNATQILYSIIVFFTIATKNIIKNISNIYSTILNLLNI